MRNIYFIFASGFGTGYAPIAPGTAGSLLAVLAAYFLIQDRWFILIACILFFFFVGVYSATFVERELERHDPSLVVIDEMVGMWISVLFLPLNGWIYALAFGAFRLFDVWKPFPVNKFQGLPDGWGVMMDDVVAGLYAMVLVHFLTRIML
ncbi:MAG: phosphatidylglycerophosphatase A [Calditrichaeota bacterium]|nr:phosphatidylglycerophosphatase A [Calditrichota bacterium]